MSDNNNKFTKWVACWGNATSITDRTAATYAKDITLRYPIRVCFSGDKLRFRFSNLTGSESVKINAYVAKIVSGNNIEENTNTVITLNGKELIELAPGKEYDSDEVDFPIEAGETIAVSMYLPDYTQMNAGTLITGPLSKGLYSYGNYARSSELPDDYTRNTNWFYFLNTVDVHTLDCNHALVCYGDSITAQDWPDYLAIRAWDNGYRNVSIIRRAVSGTRILREYSCITYAAYGLKGGRRFPIEVNTAGVAAIILQHGINDIIHPVGVEVNRFRPMSDLPTALEMEEAFTKLYIEPSKALGLKVYSGTLLPIYGWRTYAEFREELKNEFNEWLKNVAACDGCIDFDKAVRDAAHPERFKDGYDSGDHLHPSAAAYKAMAELVPEVLLK